jgi:hypothetical protein
MGQRAAQAVGSLSSLVSLRTLALTLLLMPLASEGGDTCHVGGLYAGEPGFMCTGAYTNTNRTHDGRPLYTHYTAANSLMLMFYDQAEQSWIIGPSLAVATVPGRCMDVRDGRAKQPSEIANTWSGFDWDGNLEPNKYICVWCSLAGKTHCDEEGKKMATSKPSPAPTTTPTAWAPWWPQGPEKHGPSAAPTALKIPSWEQQDGLKDKTQTSQLHREALEVPGKQF